MLTYNNMYGMHAVAGVYESYTFVYTCCHTALSNTTTKLTAPIVLLILIHTLIQFSENVSTNQEYYAT